MSRLCRYAGGLACLVTVLALAACGAGPGSTTQADAKVIGNIAFQQGETIRRIPLVDKFTGKDLAYSATSDKPAVTTVDGRQRRGHPHRNSSRPRVRRRSRSPPRTLRVKPSNPLPSPCQRPQWRFRTFRLSRKMPPARSVLVISSAGRISPTMRRRATYVWLPPRSTTPRTPSP